MNNKFGCFGNFDYDINYCGNCEIVVKFFKLKDIDFVDVELYMNGLDFNYLVCVEIFVFGKNLW